MNQIIRFVDKRLNSVTMYRLVIYALGALLIFAIILCFAQALPYSGWALLASTLALIIGCYATNHLLALLFRVPANTESYLITALILACILPPSTDPMRLAYITLAGALAMTSKYLITWRQAHIFNPAAIAAVIVSLTGILPVTWWIGTPVMLPLVILFGGLIARKIRRFMVVITFIGAALAMTLFVGLANNQPIGHLLINAVLSGPLIFFATIMLTEPATMPARSQYQRYYALLVGLLFAAQLRYGVFSSSPHMVLVIGNLFAFLVTPHFRARLRLIKVNQLAPQVYEYIFAPSRPVPSLAGQYMEWTLPYKGSDRRGNRRTFTIASSPTEKIVRLGVKYYQSPSTYKVALSRLRPGDTLIAGQVAGSFTLPASQKKKLAFVAGGIGITPFRSMLQYIIDTAQERDIHLLYLVSNAKEAVYLDVFDQAKSHGLNVTIVDSSLHSDLLNKELIQEFIPDWSERIFYISGPSAMVEHTKTIARQLGVKRSHIKADYFSGY